MKPESINALAAELLTPAGQRLVSRLVARQEWLGASATLLGAILVLPEASLTPEQHLLVEELLKGVGMVPVDLFPAD